MERKSINIDQSKVNDILKLLSKSTQIYDELLDENKQPLTVASKQYTVVINILIKSHIFLILNKEYLISLFRIGTL